MSKVFILPSELFLQRNNQDPVFLYKNNQIFWPEFCANVSNLADNLSKSDEKKWAIFLEDTFLFAIGFFALLLAKKTIILPHNIQPKTLEMLYDVKVLSEISYDKDASLKTENLSKISLNSEIIFFTSGSSGIPKQIYKNFSNLEEEITQISKMWQNNSEILASTVTHQHIYGFLFRLLWPICQGILINSETILTLEQLDSLAKNYSKITLISSPAYLKRHYLPTLPENNFNSNFEYIFSSGGLLAKSDANQTAKTFGNFPIEILGSTETGGVGWRNQENGEIWTKFPKVAIKLQNSDSLMVKSPYIYEDNYIAMGDTAEILDENHFILKERNDRIIKIEEKRVSLREIENRILESNLVKNCYALILEKKRQIVGVALELTEIGENFLKENGKAELNLLLKKQLLNYFEPIVIPRKWRYISSLPINSQGKIIYDEIKKMF